MSFERWFARATHKFEFFLCKLALFLLVFLIISQVVLTRENTRSFLSVVDQLEGVPLEEYYGQEIGQPVISYGEEKGAGEEFFLVLQARGEGGPGDYHDLKVVVNLDNITTFTSPQLRINVKPGDMIEIDGRENNFPVEVSVIDHSPQVASTFGEASVTTWGTIELLGWVIAD